MAEQSLPAIVPEIRTVRLFLEEAASSSLPEEVKAEVSCIPLGRPGSYYYELQWPSISLFCQSKECDAEHFFDPADRKLNLGQFVNRRLEFLIYTCRQCKKTWKIFAVSVGGEEIQDGTAKINIMKYGENPPAIGPAPRALKNLLGDQWPLYIQGRRSELAGLGIGAFTYYRRVVENVWQTVLERLVEVARIEGFSERLKALGAARAEKEFTRSMEQAKGFIPGSLYVDGHNPFQALYDACGDGLHEYSDEECIRRSRLIRLVLRRFSEPAKAVLSEDAEFRSAVGALAKKTGHEETGS